MAKKKIRAGKSRSQKGHLNKNRDRLWIGLSAAILIVAAFAGVFILGLGDQKMAVAQTLPREIDVQEAAEMRSEGAFILDVRQPEEWDVLHIPGATLIPLGELQSRLDEIPADQEIVVYCRSGNRSQEGRDILLNNGFSQVTSMGGGIRAWQAAGLEITTGEE